MQRRIAPLAVVFVLASCSGFKKIQVYTEPQEMAIGEIFSSEVESYMPVLRDPRIDWYLNHRGRQFADISDRRNLPYTFGVIDSPELNAFAIPGGHIYVNLGMIEATENECELMGIAAHEIGHVVAQHSMKTLSQQTIISIVGNIALNQYPNQWAALAANLFGTTGFLKMSRDAESEADRIGFELMVRAGYDPACMTAIFEDLIKRYRETPGMLDKLFSTHPPTHDRIDAINLLIDNTDLPPNLVRTTPEFERVREYIHEHYYTESGRRRWKEQLERQERKKAGEEDRLPWDTKQDDEKRKKQEELKRKQEKKDGGGDQAGDEDDSDSEVETVVSSLAPPEVGR